MIVWDSVGQTRRIWNMGYFPFNKNSGFIFGKFHVPNGTVHSGCTNPTQATISLMVIVLVSRIQNSGTGGNNFVKLKEIFWSDWPKWPDQSKRTTFKAGPEYSSQTKPKWSVPFDVLTEISRILVWMESTHGFTHAWVCDKQQFYCSHHNDIIVFCAVRDPGSSWVIVFASNWFLYM